MQPKAAVPETKKHNRPQTKAQETLFEDAFILLTSICPPAVSLALTYERRCAMRHERSKMHNKQVIIHSVHIYGMLEPADSLQGNCREWAYQKAESFRSCSLPYEMLLAVSLRS
jgi:hypothetical protein